MRIERGDVSVALLLTMGLIIALSALFWTTRPDNEYFALFVRLDRVEGLDEQTPVRLFGFPVGRIQGITPQINEAGSVDFRVELRIEQEFLADSTLYIPMGTVARVSQPSIVGSPFIVLEAPESGGAALPFGAEIPGVGSEPFFDHFQRIADDITAAVEETLTRTNALMDHLEGTLGRVDGTIASTEEQVLEVLGSVSSSVQAAERLTVRIESQVDTLSPSMRAALDSATVVLRDARLAVSRVDGMLVTVDDLVGTATPELTAILSNLDSATVRLNYFVNRVSERPVRLLTGVRPPPDTIPR
jgi:ABC-type transporter Mla subunit MlaD